MVLIGSIFFFEFMCSCVYVFMCFSVFSCIYVKVFWSCLYFFFFESWKITWSGPSLPKCGIFHKKKEWKWGLQCHCKWLNGVMLSCLWNRILSTIWTGDCVLGCEVMNFLKFTFICQQQGLPLEVSISRSASTKISTLALAIFASTISVLQYFESNPSHFHENCNKHQFWWGSSCP